MSNVLVDAVHIATRENNSTGYRERLERLRKRAKEAEAEVANACTLFTEEVRKKKQAELMESHITVLSNHLKTLDEDIGTSITEKEAEIHKVKYPLFTSDNEAERLIAAVEMNSAMLVGELYPTALIEEAYRAGRVDFCSALIDRVYRTPRPPLEKNSPEGIVERHRQGEEFGGTVTKLYGAKLSPLQNETRLLSQVENEAREFAERVRDGLDVTHPLPRATREAFPPGINAAQLEQ
ncbi:MAG: hypothetical protein WBH56_08785 [Bacteroidota bacterium]